MSSDSGSNRENESENQTIAEDFVVTKYKMAADIVNFTLKKLIEMCKPGASVLDICEAGDKMLNEETGKVFKKDKDLKKGISFPTCISVNNVICHYSPLRSEEGAVVLKDADLVKIDLGAHVDGFAAAVGHTFVIGASSDHKVVGRKADVILAGYYAAEAALRMLKPENDNFQLSDILAQTVKEFNCTLVENMTSNQTEKNHYDGEKSIVLNPSDDVKKNSEKCSFETYEVWILDILVSTSSDGKSREHTARTTVYKKKPTVYQLKMKASRQFYSELSNKFENFPFNLRAFEDERKARLGVAECAKHELVQPLSVLHEKENEFVSQFKFTVLLMPNGPMKITGLPFDLSLYQSDCKIVNEKVHAVLSSQMKKNKGKKKKAKKTANGDVPNEATASTEN